MYTKIFLFAKVLWLVKDVVAVSACALAVKQRGEADVRGHLFFGDLINAEVTWYNANQVSFTSLTLSVLVFMRKRPTWISVSVMPPCEMRAYPTFSRLR